MLSDKNCIKSVFHKFFINEIDLLKRKLKLAKPSPQHCRELPFDLFIAEYDVKCSLIADTRYIKYITQWLAPHLPIHTSTNGSRFVSKNRQEAVKSL